MAENYCDDICEAGGGETKSQLLLSLLSIYLNPADTNREKFTSLAADLINNRAEDIRIFLLNVKQL